MIAVGDHVQWGSVLPWSPVRHGYVVELGTPSDPMLAAIANGVGEPVAVVRALDPFAGCNCRANGLVLVNVSSLAPYEEP